jgi:hypothetical protein
MCREPCSIRMTTKDMETKITTIAIWFLATYSKMISMSKSQAKSNRIIDSNQVNLKDKHQWLPGDFKHKPLPLTRMPRRRLRAGVAWATRWRRGPSSPNAPSYLWTPASSVLWTIELDARGQESIHRGSRRTARQVRRIWPHKWVNNLLIKVDSKWIGRGRRDHSWSSLLLTRNGCSRAPSTPNPKYSKARRCPLIRWKTTK